MNTQYVCVACSQECCFTCRSPFHPNLTCSEYRESRISHEHSIEEVASERYLISCTKTCFRCLRKVEKVEGCDHITCYCGAEWCWTCRADYAGIKKGGARLHDSRCEHYRGDMIRV